MNNIFAGVLGGIGATEGQKMMDKHVHRETDNEGLFHHLHRTICELLDEMKLIADHYRGLQEPPIDTRIVLQTTKTVPLSTRGRKYNMIFSGNNTTQIQALIPGLGNVAFTPPIGWTELDFENGTELSLVNGSDTTIIFRCTNVPMGANVL